jgi:hypothetical protein
MRRLPPLLPTRQSSSALASPVPSSIPASLNRSKAQFGAIHGLWKSGVPARIAINTSKLSRNFIPTTQVIALFCRADDKLFELNVILDLVAARPLETALPESCRFPKP